LTVEERLASDPRYRAFVRDRQRFGWALTMIMALIYSGFIVLIAFDKALLGLPVAAGATTTLAVIVGGGMLVCPILICAIYVARANREFDARLAVLLSDAGT
jgi:uncharacterized membrane protein (DUF485 family)